MTPEPRIPTPEGLNAEFYAHAHGGVLHLQQCSDCDRVRHPPRYYCAACGSGRFRWVSSPGRGRLFSWTVTHTPVDRGWAAEIPYVTGVIELDEGVRLIGSLPDVTVEDLEIGAPLVAHLEPHGPDFSFITLRPGELPD